MKKNTNSDEYGKANENTLLEFCSQTKKQAALYKESVLFRARGDFTGAILILEKLADTGHSLSQLNLG